MASQQPMNVTFKFFNYGNVYFNASQLRNNNADDDDDSIDVAPPTAFRYDDESRASSQSRDDDSIQADEQVGEVQGPPDDTNVQVRNTNVRIEEQEIQSGNETPTVRQNDQSIHERVETPSIVVNDQEMPASSTSLRNLGEVGANDTRTDNDDDEMRDPEQKNDEPEGMNSDAVRTAETGTENADKESHIPEPRNPDQNLGEVVVRLQRIDVKRRKTPTKADDRYYYTCCRRHVHRIKSQVIRSNWMANRRLSRMVYGGAPGRRLFLRGTEIGHMAIQQRRPDANHILYVKDCRCPEDYNDGQPNPHSGG